jgi:uncharacterized protein YoxC
LNRNLLIAVALVVAIIALGGNFFVLYTENSTIDQNKTSLSSQITGLQNSITSLQGTINTLNNQLTQEQQTQSSEAQTVAGIQSDLQGVRAQLANVVTEFNSNRTNDLAFQGQVYAQLQSISSSLTTLANRLNSLTPQIPLTTLVIVGSSYDNVTNAFTFEVKNNLNSSVFAQLSAVVEGTTSNPDLCNGVAGSYISGVTSFGPLSVTPSVLSLPSITYNGCATNPVTTVTVIYVASNSTQVSKGYSFSVVPAYNHP